MIARISHETFTDGRGLLSVFNLSTEFAGFQRVFLTSNGKVGNARGGHAHREQKQIFFAIQGSFEITFNSRGESGTIVLEPESDGILMPSLYWSTQTPMSENAVLLVFASGLYDETEYIRDLNEFNKVLND